MACKLRTAVWHTNFESCTSVAGAKKINVMYDVERSHCVHCVNESLHRFAVQSSHSLTWSLRTGWMRLFISYIILLKIQTIVGCSLSNITDSFVLLNYPTWSSPWCRQGREDILLWSLIMRKNASQWMQDLVLLHLNTQLHSQTTFINLCLQILSLVCPTEQKNNGKTSFINCRCLFLKKLKKSKKTAQAQKRNIRSEGADERASHEAHPGGENKLERHLPHARARGIQNSFSMFKSTSYLFTRRLLIYQRRKESPGQRSFRSPERNAVFIS